MRKLTVVYTLTDETLEQSMEGLLKKGAIYAGRATIACQEGDVMAERDELKQLVEEFFLPVWPADYIERMRKAANQNEGKPDVQI